MHSESVFIFYQLPGFLKASLYPLLSVSLSVFSSVNHSVCPSCSQIPSLQTSEGADEAQCGEGGEVRTEERDGGVPAGDHLHDKVLIR